MRIPTPPVLAQGPLRTRRPLATPLLAAAMLAVPLLAGCAREPAVTGAAAQGSTVETIRGGTGLGEPLKPEPGNIWADGLTPATNPGLTPGQPGATSRAPSGK